MWIIICLVVAFVVWHFLPAPKPPEPSPRFRHDFRINASNPQWRSVIADHSESPAETAFLEAMIKAFQLTPKLGSLVGQGLKLDFQVEQGPYRADFLANSWLVIEIDGAAWHSSPEAKARDRTRDSYFESLGYTVLRIPAKLVFNNPDEVTQKVRSALATGKREIKLPPQSTGFERLGQTFSTINKSISDLNDYVSRQRAIEGA